MPVSGQSAVRTADETGGFQDLLLPLLLASQVSEGVDDDTKDEVEYDDDHHEEEQKVVNHSGCKQRLLRCPVSGKTHRKPTLGSDFNTGLCSAIAICCMCC